MLHSEIIHKKQYFVLTFFWMLYGKGEGVCIQIFHFAEIQSSFCPYFQNGLGFFNLAALIQVSIKAFWHFYTWNWDICACSLQLQLQLPIAFSHWYTLFTSFLTWCKFETYIGDKFKNFLINKVRQWIFQFDHLTFSKNVFVFFPFAKSVTFKNRLCGLLKCCNFY